MWKKMLSSRKVWVAIITLITTVSFGFQGERLIAAGITPESFETTLLGIVGTGSSLILGIAWEDSSAKKNGTHPSQNGENK